MRYYVTSYNNFTINIDTLDILKGYINKNYTSTLQL